MRLPINIKRLIESMELNKVARVYVVGSSKTRCMAAGKELKKWLADYESEIEYNLQHEIAYEKHHLDDVLGMSSIVVLVGDWYKNKKVRDIISRIADLGTVPNITISDVECYNSYTKECEEDYTVVPKKEVVVGVDASLTTDLTAITIMYKESGNYYLKRIEDGVMQYTFSNDNECMSYQGTPEQIAKLIRLQREIDNKDNGHTVTIKPNKEFTESLRDFSDRLKEVMKCKANGMIPGD